ncbi:MAG: phage tail tape measure protein, partial [Phycisphaera sp.]|nr:phage tail tape measure protein [Phycisphaera sp.]
MVSPRAIRAGAAYVELYITDSKLVRGLNLADKRLKAFGASVTSIGRRITAIGSAAAVPFIGATRVFTSFSDQMLTVKAVTGATEDEFARLTDQAKLLGRTTSFTAAQVAGAMTEL